MVRRLALDQFDRRRDTALLGLLVLLVIGWVVGLVPMVTRATIGDCSTTVDGLENPVQSCFGHWNRGLGTETGPLLGVERKKWQATTPDATAPDNREWSQYDIPRGERSQWVLVVMSRAYLLPLWLAFVVAVAIYGLILLLIRRIWLNLSRRPKSNVDTSPSPSPTESAQ